jgi:hypothetical protein
MFIVENRKLKLGKRHFVFAAICMFLFGVRILGVAHKVLAPCEGLGHVLLARGRQCHLSKRQHEAGDDDQGSHSPHASTRLSTFATCAAFHSPSRAVIVARPFPVTPLPSS